MSHKSSKRKRGGHEEEHESHERWLITYADMLTLLMVLFIVMFAMSTVDAKKFALLKAGLAIGFGSTSSIITDESQPLTTGGAANSAVQAMDPGVDPHAASSSQDDPKTPSAKAAAAKAAQTAVSTADRAKAEAQAASAVKEADNLEQIAAKIRKALRKKGVSDGVLFNIDQRGLVVTVLTSAVVFAGDQAALLSGGRRLLDAIEPTLSTLPNDMEVDGHTNQLNVPSVNYPSGWELSTARASTVVRYLIGKGIAPKRLTAAGFASNRPLYPPSSPLAVTRNRRVEIVVLSALPSEERKLLPSVAK
jgi:chemotaxis protein MotB